MNFKSLALVASLASAFSVATSKISFASDARLGETTPIVQDAEVLAVVPKDSVVVSKLKYTDENAKARFSITASFFLGSNECFADGVTPDFKYEIVDGTLNIYPIKHNAPEHAEKLCYLLYKPVIENFTKELQFNGSDMKAITSIVLNNVDSEGETVNLTKDIIEN